MGREFVLQENVFAAPLMARLRDWALASPYIGDSPLKGTFQASRGFAITFTRIGLGGVARRFPELWPFLEQALMPSSWTHLFGPVERWVRRLQGRQPNAFYLNMLVVPPGASVGAHVDATLSDGGGAVRPPLLVSVLYIQTTPGGLLELSRGARQIASIAPTAGSVLHFRGDLLHRVTPVADAGAPRLSLVCEQYALAPERAARLAPVTVNSQGLFERTMAAAKQKPRGDFVVD